MNEIIFLMWMADAVSNLQAVLFITSCIALLSGIFLVGGFLIEGKLWCLTALKIGTPVIALFLLMASILPGKQTMHAIVAMKAGYELSQTSIGKKSAEAIEAILDQVISQAKK